MSIVTRFVGLDYHQIPPTEVTSTRRLVLAFWRSSGRATLLRGQNRGLGSDDG